MRVVVPLVPFVPFAAVAVAMAVGVVVGVRVRHGGGFFFVVERVEGCLWLDGRVGKIN